MFGSNILPYFRSCSWQLPKTESEVPRMSSDVGVSRIWNRMLDAAFDNSNRYKKIKLPSDVVNNLLEVFDFSSIPEAKYDRFVLMHLHPPEAFRDAESGGARECQYHIQNIFFPELSKYYLSQRSQQFPSRKKTLFFFIVDGNTGWVFWGRWWEKRDWLAGCRRAPGNGNWVETRGITGPTSPTGWPSSRPPFSSYHYFCTDSDHLGWTFTRGPIW